jgi:hypothetical protein
VLEASSNAATAPVKSRKGSSLPAAVLGLPVRWPLLPAYSFCQTKAPQKPYPLHYRSKQQHRILKGHPPD